MIGLVDVSEGRAELAGQESQRGNYPEQREHADHEQSGSACILGRSREVQEGTASHPPSARVGD